MVTPVGGPAKQEAGRHWPTVSDQTHQRSPARPTRCTRGAPECVPPRHEPGDETNADQAAQHESGRSGHAPRPERDKVGCGEASRNQRHRRQRIVSARDLKQGLGLGREPQVHESAQQDRPPTGGEAQQAAGGRVRLQHERGNAIRVPSSSHGQREFQVLTAAPREPTPHARTGALLTASSSAACVEDPRHGADHGPHPDSLRAEQPGQQGDVEDPQRNPETLGQEEREEMPHRGRHARRPTCFSSGFDTIGWSRERSDLQGSLLSDPRRPWQGHPLLPRRSKASGRGREPRKTGSGTTAGLREGAVLPTHLLEVTRGHAAAHAIRAARDR